MSETHPDPQKLRLIERFFIWLSAADSKALVNFCPRWERLKYEAFGASLLVPFLFGMIAASYAVSTLTQSWLIIVGFALIWGFIIITIDRVLMSTYRAHVSLKKKALQFVLRITVAVLMGLTVSHPLTLLLFKDTITSEIEKSRVAEMAEARAATEAEKKALDERILQATGNLQEQQRKYQEVIGGGFLNDAPEAPRQPPEAKQRDSQFADIDAQIENYRNERDQVQEDLNRWQRVYDDEISGSRTGKPGIGPNARALERDELVWRREEVRRLGGVISDLTSKRTELSSRLLADSAAANAVIESSRRELEQQKLEIFKGQQKDMLKNINGQIETATAELNRLQEDAKQLSLNTRDRVDSLKTEKRADLMTQTLVLHRLFEKEGGGFALAVYVVIAGLFTLIDTIPLVVKFFSEPGLYDKYLEVKESGDREKLHAFVRSSLIFEDGNHHLDYIDSYVKKTFKELDAAHSISNYRPNQISGGAFPEVQKLLPLHENLGSSAAPETPIQSSEKETEETVPGLNLEEKEEKVADAEALIDEVTAEDDEHKIIVADFKGSTKEEQTDASGQQIQKKNESPSRVAPVGSAMNVPPKEEINGRVGQGILPGASAKLNDSLSAQTRTRSLDENEGSGASEIGEATAQKEAPLPRIAKGPSPRSMQGSDVAEPEKFSARSPMRRTPPFPDAPIPENQAEKAPKVRQPNGVQSMSNLAEQEEGETSGEALARSIAAVENTKHQKTMAKAEPERKPVVEVESQDPKERIKEVSDASRAQRSGGAQDFVAEESSKPKNDFVAKPEDPMEERPSLGMGELMGLGQNQSPVPPVKTGTVLPRERALLSRKGGVALNPLNLDDTAKSDKQG